MSQGNLFTDQADRIAYTNRLCDSDPVAAAIRDALLRVEQTYQADVEPQLFQMDRRAEPAEVHVHQPEALQPMYAQLAKRMGQDYGGALYKLALHCENLAEFMRADATSPLVPAGLTRAHQAGRDLIPVARPGFTVHGMLLASEGWLAEVSAEEAAAIEAGETAVRHMAQRRSLRMVTLYGRDGLLWSLTKLSDAERPTVLVFPPESDDVFVGQVAHALSRMVNAVCNNPVPVVPYDV